MHEFDAGIGCCEVPIGLDKPVNTDFDPRPSEKAVSLGEGRKTRRKLTPAVRFFSVCLTVKPVGEPDAGNPHVRFDERGCPPLHDRPCECRMAKSTGSYSVSDTACLNLTTFP
jgi:hypothetical protein